MYYAEHEVYRIAGNFHLEKIFAHFAFCSPLSRVNFFFYPVKFLSQITYRAYGDHYCVDEINSYSAECKGSWAERNFCSVKIFGCTVLSPELL